MPFWSDRYLSNLLTLHVLKIYSKFILWTLQELCMFFCTSSFKGTWAIFAIPYLTKSTFENNSFILIKNFSSFYGYLNLIFTFFEASVFHKNFSLNWLSFVEWVYNIDRLFMWYFCRLSNYQVIAVMWKTLHVNYKIIGCMVAL